jgi:5-aminopentanamidase
MRIALVQRNGVRPLDELSDAMASTCADLFVTPELFFGGYASGHLLASKAEGATEATFDAVAGLCRRHGSAAAYGFAERGEDGLVYNSVNLVDDEGCLLLTYRKVHLWGQYERRHFTAGKCPSPVVSFRGVRLAALICFDVEFPEAARALCLKGADVLLCPTAAGGNSFITKKLVPTRAFENGAVVVYVNRVGSDRIHDEERDISFFGESVCALADGREFRMGCEEGVLVAEVSIDDDGSKKARRENPYLSDRREDIFAWSHTQPL